MMKKIDRYVAGSFFTYFALSIFVALVIYLIVDPIENLDKFLDKGVPQKDIIRYYILYVPYIIYLTYPVAMLLATLISIGGLNAKRELLAMTASGIPLHRHLINLLTIALIMSALAFYWGETLVPYTNKERMGIWREQVKKKVDWRLLDQGQVYLQVAKQEVLHLDLYQPRHQIGHGMDLFVFEDNRLKERFSAKTLAWNGKNWIASGVMRREFTDKGEYIDHLQRLDMHFKLVPDDFIELQVEPEEMGYEELKRFVERIRLTGGQTEKWLVDLQSKIALPFAGVIIVLFGLPISSTFRRSGMVIGFGLSIAVAFIYFGLLQVGKVLGYKEILDPLPAAWLGNFVFFVIGSILYMRAPK